MKEVNIFLNNYLTDNDTVVCATSGGADSMCLLSILLKYNIKIVCAHINHNLREESFEEYEFVKKYCEDNNIIFEGLVLDKITKGNLEAEFRNKRYEFFDEMIKKYNAKYLFTAHHGDDLIETILMRIVRGSSLEGYSGFDTVVDKQSYKILRPLVYLTKDQIYDYMKENNLDYREDKTNKSDKYTRNRYRKYILPKLKEENNNVHLKFLKYSNELSNSFKFIDNYVKDIIAKNYIKEKLNLVNIKNEDEFIIKKVLFEILKYTYKDNINLISDSNLEEIVKIIKSNRPNLSIDLPLDIKMVKQYDLLEVIKGNDYTDYNYEIKDVVLVPTGKIEVLKNTNLTNNYVCHLDSSLIKLPLYVRNRKKGDYIEILNLNGKMKIKDLFINEKIPSNIRDKYPIVVDSNDNIVWIPGLKKSKYDGLKKKKYDIILWYTGGNYNE